MKVTGVEVNRTWWLSKYSPPLLLKNVLLIDDSCDSFADCLPSTSSSALMFVYFNSASAFESYINTFEGDVIIIIGPDHLIKEKNHKYCNPQPFVSIPNWSLKYSSIFQEDGDAAAIYERNRAIT